jgi:Undecaprenyl-phosphate galactose phosphotransferase WbaP
MASAAAVGVYTTASKTRPCFTGVAMAMGDLLAIALTIAAAVAVRQVFNGDFQLAHYWRLWPLLALFGVAYSLFGLYPGIAMSPTAELRTVTSATTLVYLLLGALTFVLRTPFTYSRSAFLASWLICLFTVPLTRAMLRSSLRDRSWWGYRAVVIGVGGADQAVVKTLSENPEIGLRPAAIFDDDLQPGTHVYGIPVVGGMAAAPAFAAREGITRAILAMPDSPPAELLKLLDQHGKTFSRVFMVPGLNGLSSIGVEIRDVSRMLALELRKSLLMAGPRAAKRCMDVVLSLMALIALSPVLLIIAALIRLESRGPAMYRQNRLGLGKGRFSVWKFRSMCANADQVLENYLNANPELRAEWERDHKLKKDPRVTLMGRFLRKTSLDELPQLINVLRGEMSLVGPRPIVDSEIAKYGESFALYTQVVPGLTGLWQVSGRNDTTYKERVELDTYYVRNWSPWLDIYLLARTVKVVVTGYGAY